jgi:hypothetical protein
MSEKRLRRVRKKKSLYYSKSVEKIDNAISGVIDNITLEDMKNWSWKTLHEK